MVVGIGFHLLHHKSDVFGGAPSLTRLKIEIHIVAIGYGVEFVVAADGVVEKCQLPGIHALVHLDYFLVGTEFCALGEAGPLVRTDVHTLVGVDDSGTRAAGAAIPRIGNGVGVEINRIIHHLTAKWHAKHPVVEGNIGTHAPEGSIAACKRLLTLGTVTIVGIREQFGLAKAVIALIGFHIIILISEIGLKNIGVERITGHPHNGVFHPRTNNPLRYRIHLI